jgi:hypothetical protein
VLFNLVSDLTGGIRMTVIDEDLIVAPARRTPGGPPPNRPAAPSGEHRNGAPPASPAAHRPADLGAVEPTRADR